MRRGGAVGRALCTLGLVLWVGLAVCEQREPQLQQTTDRGAELGLEAQRFPLPFLAAPPELKPWREIMLRLGSPIRNVYV